MNAVARTLRPALLLAAMALAGCGTLTPTYERPAAPLPASFPQTSAAAVPAIAAPDIDWQRHFTDARLQRLITLALQNNRDLRVAVLSIEQARATLQLRRADELPTVNGVASGSRQPNSSGGITSLYQAGLSVASYELDFFGRVKSLEIGRAHV